MQVGINITCMYTSFGGRGLSGFGDIATIQKRPNFPFGAWTIVHGHGKIQSIGIGSKNLCKQGLMSSASTPILVGVVSPVSEIKLAYGLQKWKNLIDRNQLKKFMPVGVDVTCIHTSFGGRDPFGFGDMATFQKRPNFPFGAWTIVHGHRKI